MGKPLSLKKIFFYLFTEGPGYFLILSVIALRQTLIQPFVVGQKFDWYLPLFSLKPLLSQSLSAWSGENTGAPLNYYSVWFGDFFFSLFGFLGVKPSYFIPIFLILMLTLAGFGMHRLLRYVHQPWAITTLAGLFYLLTPTLYIRILIGFTLWIVAYALAPWVILLFLKSLHTTKINWLSLSLWTGVLFGLASMQIQFFLMIGLMLIVVVLTKGHGLPVSKRLLRLVIIFFTSISLHLPWIFAMIGRSFNQVVGFLASNSSVLKATTDLSHSFLRTFFLNDHHITADHFNVQNHLPIYYIASLILLGFLFLGIIIYWSKLTFRWLILVTIIFGFFITVLPHRHLIWLYQNLFDTTQLINIFREVYHAQFLMSFGYSLAIGSIGSIIWYNQKKDQGKLAVVAGLILLTGLFNNTMLYGDFLSYGSSSPPNPQYEKLQNQFQAESQNQRVWYPLGLGFVRTRQDRNGASNGDILARSLGLPFVDESSSILNLPNGLTGVRNTMIHRFQQGGTIDNYLDKIAVNKIVERKDLVSMNIVNDNDNNLKIRKYWRSRSIEEALEEDWQKDSRFLPAIIYQKQAENNLIYPAQKPVISYNDSLQRLDQASDLIFLEQLVDKKQFKNLLPDEEFKVDQARLMSVLASEFDKTTLADTANQNYSPKQGWSQGRFSWSENIQFADQINPFIITFVPDYIEKKLIISQTGYHQVFMKIWYSPAGGLLSIGIGESSTQINTQAKTSQWRWFDLGDLAISTAHQKVSLKAISGQQAVGQIVYLPLERAQALRNQVKELEKSFEANPSISKTEPIVKSENLTPSRFKVEINNQEPFLLVFAENYDSRWLLKIGDSTFQPIPVNAWANGYWIDKPINQTGTLIYQPQTYYDLGLFIAFSTLIFIAVFTIFINYRKRFKA